MDGYRKRPSRLQKILELKKLRGSVARRMKTSGRIGMVVKTQIRLMMM